MDSPSTDEIAPPARHEPRAQRLTLVRSARLERTIDCLCIVVCGLAAVAFLRPFQDAPFVDDWTYAWSVERLLRYGDLHILEWSAHLNLFQVLWGVLFCLPRGFSFCRAARFDVGAGRVGGLCAWQAIHFNGG